ncbi:hypothetical protein [Paenibacillus larvae]|uniref:hypothetical protein n=1 Tax=Paenibacillus larvae TaxID=1464 RepID=UPI0012BA80E6|nr:hypothetical protein [Paenibacillus larvae]
MSCLRLVYRLTDALTVLTAHDKLPEEVGRMDETDALVLSLMVVGITVLAILAGN